VSEETNQPTQEETNKPAKIKGGRKAAIYRSSECLNCGQPLELTDRFCSYCSQMNTTKSLSLKDFLGEFLGSIITYDSRFRYTIKDLLFRPGIITKNYVEGKRLRYANPFRFFLSVSIIYFLIQGLTGAFGVNETNEGNNFQFGPTGDNVKIFETINNDSTAVDSIVSNALKFTDSIPNGDVYFDKEKLDSIITTAATSKKLDTVPKYKVISADSLEKMDWGERWLNRLNMYNEFYNDTGITNVSTALDSLNHPNNKWNRWAYSKVDAVEQIKKNPSDFITYLIEKIPFFLFFFTPIYALFFWLVYSSKKFTYMEHMVFIFHIFSFVFLASIIALPFDAIIGAEVVSGVLFGLVGPFYFYKALRNFYKNKRFITIIKFIFLNFVFIWIASFTAILFFVVTAIFY